MTLRLATDERVENTTTTPVDVATSDTPPTVPHVCRKPDFNALVETCPLCPGGNPDGVIAEAGEKPFRHVIASRWLVHALLQYHYTPYWPRNVDQVFATVDIRTGKVVAACVFAYPVLRCFLREQVFGVLPTETLNRDFRQLVRWMVHPDYRHENVGTDLLRWAMTKMEQPVIEAINRSWVPVAVFKELGMIERSDSERSERHYYYRLKECRKRVDEIKEPPTPSESIQGDVLHVYPRLWVMKNRLHGQAEVVFCQPYNGSPLRSHTWHQQGYLVCYDDEFTLETVEKAPLFEELHDQTKRHAMLNRIAAGLPVVGQN